MPDDATQSPASARPSRREQMRQMTVEDIKAAARDQLTQQNAGNVSLRAVAREVGLAPSAIYRYFDSQTALVAAVAVDAYHSASHALHTAWKGSSTLTAYEQFGVLFKAYRGWALANRAEFTLIFATDQTMLLDGPSLMSSLPLHEFFSTPLQMYFDAATSGQVDTTLVGLQVEARLTPEMEEVRQLLEERTGQILTHQQIAALLSGWASVQGFVTLELFGQLGWFVADLDALFDGHVRGVLAGLGLLSPDESAR